MNAATFRNDLLQDILSQPTAPFREGHIISRVTQALEEASVPFFLDPVGNVVVGVSSHSHYLKLVKKKTEEPLRIFIAHMDHPGFHGVQWVSPTELEIKWHGGSPTQHLEGAKVWLADETAWMGHGKLRGASLLSTGKAIDRAIVQFENDQLNKKYPSSSSTQCLFGGFQFLAPVWQEGEMIYTKAADDLVGAFAITSLAIDSWKKHRKVTDSPFLGLLTRAEEVGFIGAIGHFELRWLEKAKRPIVCVSLETSRTLPGAEIGKGPVIRLGDRFTVFDPGALRIFSDLAHTVLPGKHQRRVMDGGTCEATAATVYGFPCIGISVPLGNYHNQSLEGGPDAAPLNGPAPEFVHKQDIVGLIALCHALLKPKLPWSDPWKAKMKEFKKGMREYKELLQSGP